MAVAEKLCTITGCNRRRLARGYCQAHYRRWRRDGDPQAEKPIRRGGQRNREPLADRFWVKVAIREPNDCWEWQAARNGNGYGAFAIWDEHYRQVPAHRFAYQLTNGPVPDGLVLDHLCRNPLCVNPAHLEPVTVKENTLRGESMVAANHQKTHCPRGHPYDEQNTYRRPGGNRRCRICRRESKQPSQAKRAGHA